MLYTDVMLAPQMRSDKTSRATKATENQLHQCNAVLLLQVQSAAVNLLTGSAVVAVCSPAEPALADHLGELLTAKVISCLSGLLLLWMS